MPCSRQQCPEHGTPQISRSGKKPHHPPVGDDLNWEPGKCAGSCLMEKSCRRGRAVRAHLEIWRKPSDLTQGSLSRHFQLLAMCGAVCELDTVFSLQIIPPGKAGGKPASWLALSSRAHSSLEKTCSPLADKCSMLIQS